MGLTRCYKTEVFFTFINKKYRQIFGESGTGSEQLIGFWA